MNYSVEEVRCKMDLWEVVDEKTGRLSIPSTGYGIGATERCCEVPFVLSNVFKLAEKTAVLDVGMTLSDPSFFSSYLKLLHERSACFHALDILELKAQRFNDLPLHLAEYLKQMVFHKGDVRTVAFPVQFDMITCVSTIEHVGFDIVGVNQSGEAILDRLYQEKLWNQESYNSWQQDFVAVKQMSSWLKPGGCLALTVPFGKGYIASIRDSLGLNANFIHYDWERWQKLIACSGLKVAENRVFSNVMGTQKSWQEVDPSDVTNVMFDIEQSCARAVACVTLVRDF